MVVEDEEELRDMVGDGLSRDGFRVMKAGKLHEAIGKIRNQKFGCILVDLDLGESGSGEEVITTTRADKNHLNYHTPIVLMSGTVDKDVLMRIKDAINGAVVKPFSMEALLQKVRSVVHSGG